MSVRVALRPTEAITQLAFALAWERKGKLPVYANGKPQPHAKLGCEKPLALGRRLAGMAHDLDFERSAQVAAGLPMLGSYVFSSTLLWCWVKGTEQVKRAAAFVPTPSIVLRLGSSSERLLLWGLEEPLAAELVERHNDRLAHALRAPRTRSKPDALRVPMPGTFMRVGRGRPAPVVVTRLTLGQLSLQNVSGRLRDAPSRDAWRERR